MFRYSFLFSIFVLLSLWGCSPVSDHETAHTDHAHESTGHTRTVWTDKLEAFVEMDNLVVGEPAHALIHLTNLADFSPLGTEHHVSLSFQPEAATKPVSTEATWNRAGICEAHLIIDRPSTGELSLTLNGTDGPIRLDLGMVSIGTEQQPGSFVMHENPDHEAVDHTQAAERDHYDHAESGHADDHLHEGQTHPEPDVHDATRQEEPAGQLFTKEQQWGMDFRTAPAQMDSLPAGITVFGRVEARSGFDIVLTAPVDGVVTATRWPTGGTSTSTGEVLFHLTPKVSGDFSLTGLNAEVQALQSQLQLSQSRLDRLEHLLESGTVSRWEVEDARVQAQTLTNRLTAARSDLQTARSMRTRSGERNEELDIRSPLTGSITHVRVTPGQFVTAGKELIHLVRERPIQLELAIPVQQTDVLALPLTGLYLRSFTDREPVYIGPEEMRVLAHTPGVDPETGKITLYLEINRSLKRYPLHAMVEAELLFEDSIEGIVIPVSALVDDAGSFVIYRQLSGERFIRTPVHIVQRTGDRVMITGVSPDARIVVRGGQAVRRAEMVGSGSFQDHGHSH